MNPIFLKLVSSTESQSNLTSYFLRPKQTSRTNKNKKCKLLSKKEEIEVVNIGIGISQLTSVSVVLLDFYSKRFVLISSPGTEVNYMVRYGKKTRKFSFPFVLLFKTLNWWNMKAIFTLLFPSMAELSGAEHHRRVCLDELAG